MGARKRTYSLSEMLLNEYRVEGAVCLRIILAEGAGIDLNPLGRRTLHLVLAGEVPITLADGTARLLAPGDCALVSYGERHLLGSSPGTGFDAPPWNPLDMADQPIEVRPAGAGGEPAGVDNAVVLSFFLTFAAGATRPAGIRSVPKLWVVPGESPALPVRMDLPNLTRALEGPGSSAIATRLAAYIFTCITSQLSQELLWGADAKRERTVHSRHIAAIIKQVRAAPDQAWTVETMARAVGMSRSTFAMAFTEATGVAPMTFLTRERMERAASLLRAEVLSLQEIGFRIGYPIESSFARAFRRYWAIGPREYQKRYAKSDPA